MKYLKIKISIILLTTLVACNINNSPIEKPFVTKVTDSVGAVYKLNVYEDFRSKYATADSNLAKTSDENIFIVQFRFSDIKNITEFIERIPNCTYFEALSIIGTKLEKEILERLMHQLSTRKHFKKLLLISTQIEEIPPSIQHLKHLHTLELSRNPISKLPSEICKLKNLRYLRIYNNRSITLLPDEFGKLKKLEYLDFAGTRLTEIPTSIGGCKNLISITGNACRITHIPKELGKCTNLVCLYLPYNLIEEVPKEVKDLKKLKALTI